MVVRARKAGRQHDSRAMPAVAGKRPVGTLGGSAGYDNGKQCNRKA
jgi:hypothetical protein